MNDGILKLENQLCFPLYVAAKEVISRYTPFLDEIGLTYTQYIAMMVLWDKKTVTVKELGKYLYLDSGTLTPLLKRMEAKGYIKRERAAGDERSLTVTVTAAGEVLKASAEKIPQKMAQCMPLPMEDIGTLYSLLYKIIGQIQRGNKE